MVYKTKQEMEEKYIPFIFEAQLRRKILVDIDEAIFTAHLLFYLGDYYNKQRFIFPQIIDFKLLKELSNGTYLYELYIRGFDPDSHERLRYLIKNRNERIKIKDISIRDKNWFINFFKKGEGTLDDESCLILNKKHHICGLITKELSKKEPIKINF
jgi:hypothetical protein